MRIGETDCELLLLAKLFNFEVLLENRLLSHGLVRLVTLFDQFVVYTTPTAVKMFGPRVLCPYSRHVVGCLSNTMVLSCICCGSKLFSLACEEGQNLCSVLIDQLTCSENPMLTIGVLVEVGKCKEQCARHEENAQDNYLFLFWSFRERRYYEWIWAFLDFYTNCEKRLFPLSCLSVRRSVRMEQLGSHWTDCHEI
jgi:hypothetical protein